MSRLYDCEIEIRNIPLAKEEKICDVISENLDSIDDLEETLDEKSCTLRCFSQTSLCGGESTEEAHNRITLQVHAIAPEAKVITRWHSAEWEWDYEYYPEDD